MIKCLLWDFGDTLCDELSLWRDSPLWMDVYRSFDEDDGIGAAWSLGELETHEVAAKLARRMPLSEAQILEHLSRTDLFQFFPFTYAFFRAHHLPQAVVTVNPASFRQMAERLAFDKVVDAIVVSPLLGGHSVQRALLDDFSKRRALNRTTLVPKPETIGMA